MCIILAWIFNFVPNKTISDAKIEFIYHTIGKHAPAQHICTAAHLSDMRWNTNAGRDTMQQKGRYEHPTYGTPTRRVFPFYVRPYTGYSNLAINEA